MKARRSGLSRVAERVIGRALRLPSPTSDYTVTRRVAIPMRDGVQLAADLYQPTSAPVGTLLVRGPYGRHYPMAFAMARIFAARGYNCLFVSSRGTFGSGGRFEPMITEVDDGRDTVTWMAAQSWFTGTFATLGPSYLGFTQWALLTDPPPQMAAAVISVGPHDFSRHVWGTGSFRLDFLAWSYQVIHQEDHSALVTALTMATNQRRIKPALDRIPLTDAGASLLDGRAPWYSEWVTRPDLDDPFWAPMQLGVALERVQIPILLISGWNDIFLEQTVEQFRRLRARGLDAALTIGPWSHIEAAGTASAVTVRETLDWLDEHLAGRARRRRGSPVRVFVTGPGEWRDLPGWPPETSRQVFYLHPDRTMSPAPPAREGTPSSFVFDPAHPTPTVGGPLLSGKCLVDDRELAARADVLSFTGPALDAGLEMLGRATVELAHQSDPRHADLFVRISEVSRDGRSDNITEGYTRLDPDRPEGLVTLPLRDAAHRFAAGSRIRLLIAGGSHPQFARNLGTGENPGRGHTMLPTRHSIGHRPGATSRLILPTRIP